MSSMSRCSLPLRHIIRACSARTTTLLELPTPAAKAVFSLNRQLNTQIIAEPTSSFYVSKRLQSDTYSNDESVVFSLESDEEFAEKVLESTAPVLVDFYADWCGPCRMLGPRLEAKVRGCGGNVLLAKVDVDSAASLAMQYEINAVPTVLAFKNGEMIERMEGDHGDDYIDQMISNLVQ